MIGLPRWRRADVEPLIDVHEHPDIRTEVVVGPLAGKLAADLVKHTIDRQKLRELGRAYGRASRQIHALRGEHAMLREEMRDLDQILSDERHLVEELQCALDARRPAPDAAELGRQLKAVWFRPSGYRMVPDELWEQVAETAIDAVRGLWPTHAPDVPPRTPWEAAADDAPLAAWEVAALDAEAAQRILLNQPIGGTPETSPGGGESAGVPVAPTGDPAPGDPIRYCPRCGHDVEALPPRRICDECEEQLGAAADEHREQLARVLARRDITLLSCGTWEAWTERLREYYRAGADDVILAGWRPPVAQLVDPDRLPVVARMLTDHELLADDTCRCGWDGSALWHAEHIAEQLLGTGTIA